MDNIERADGKLGIDTGGTFTDLVYLDSENNLQIYKVLSTPTDPADAILDGVDAMNIPSSVSIIHGSTVATNALLERRGAATALITTAGFRDVLAIGRQNRPELYALVPKRPDPLVPRRWRFEVDERVTAQGEILRALDPTGLSPTIDQIARLMANEGIESVAICLLFSFLRPEHERLIERVLIERWPKVQKERLSIPHISLSSDILPEFREYERTATTVINAYVAPLMSRYLQRLEREVAPRRLTVMQSNGGIINAAVAGNQAARTVLSGPAGGVVGARYIAGQLGYEQIITFDMGGTSTDVALCPGHLPTTSEGEIAGFPLRLPMIDIHTVGAGGGSLSHIDAAGALQVGPQSAGADPGPACYGLAPLQQSHLVDKEASAAVLSPSLSRATVTDANLILGRLDANHFLGGEMSLDAPAAATAIDQVVNSLAAKSREEAAWGIIEVANANMERAIRRISVERGFDPRLFTLVAFGGAGPLHACDLARALQIPRVIVPPTPGVLSALGMLVAKPTREYSKTVMRQLDADGRIPAWMAKEFIKLEEQASAAMVEEGYGAGDLILTRGLDMRYVGQSYELTVRPPDSDEGALLSMLFHEAHEKRYAFRRPNASIEIVNVRLMAQAVTKPLQIPTIASGRKRADQAAIGRKLVWFDQEYVNTILYDRERLRRGNRFHGPAIIFQYDTTTVVPPGWGVRVEPSGTLLLSDGVLNGG